MRMPLQRALPTRPPPTSLLTQLSVIHDCVIRRATRSEKLRVSSRSTMPWMRSDHSSGSMVGFAMVVSIR